MSDPKAVWRLFAFHPMDYKAAERWLCGRAAAGWRVDRFALRGLLVRLVPDGRTGLKYCVDITDRKNTDSAEYAKLCRDSGWNWVDTVGQMSVYASRPGGEAPPIQTDGGLEAERFAAKYLRRSFQELALTLAILAALALALLLLWPDMLLDSMCSWTEFIPLIDLAVLLLLALWELAALLRYRRAALAAVRTGEGMPARSPAAARVWPALRLCVLLLWLLLIVLPSLSALLSPPLQDYGPDRRSLLRDQPVVMAEDLGLDASRIGNSYFESGDTPLLSYRSLLDPLGSLRTYHYRFAWEPLARWGAGVLLGEEELPLEPVELGFDASWTYDRGDGFHVLLLRQGETVVLLSGESDWTAPEVREMLWARLDLEPAQDLGPPFRGAGSRAAAG